METKLCTYCGKELLENESVSVSFNGENCADFCSVECFRKNANRNLKSMKFKTKKELEAYARKLKKDYRTVQLNKLLENEFLTSVEAATLFRLLSAKEKHRLAIIGMGICFVRNDGCTKKIMERIRGK